MAGQTHVGHLFDFASHVNITTRPPPLLWVPGHAFPLDATRTPLPPAAWLQALVLNGFICSHRTPARRVFSPSHPPHGFHRLQKQQSENLNPSLLAPGRSPYTTAPPPGRVEASAWSLTREQAGGDASRQEPGGGQADPKLLAASADLSVLTDPPRPTPAHPNSQASGHPSGQSTANASLASGRQINHQMPVPLELQIHNWNC